ncbi:MAG: hypothetical protein M3137_16670 [Actinomycetota bacterium]|nr:hypothetical protein [Actinomycetota bacterium]
MINPNPPPEPTSSPAGTTDRHDLARALGALRNQVGHLETLIGPEVDAVRLSGKDLRPGWQHSYRGESRLPVAVAVILAIGLQIALPAHLVFKPTWLLPGLEGAVLVGITLANPRRISRTSTLLRTASTALIALTSLANAWSSGQLIHGLINGTEGQNAGPLLSSGGSIYLTNIIVFALWYWEWDRGGPVARSQGRRLYPDFLFPQMTQAHLAPDNWVPTFFDYAYLSFTNATAFSPTDTMPLARWAKMLMLIQSAVSLITLALVIARAVNILK